MTTTGFAVAGGQSLRMASDKALLPWGETDLLGHALNRLREACGTVAILSPHRLEDRGVAVHPDVVVGAGPLGGVLTGLTILEADLGLFLAVDLPLVPVPLLRHLIFLAEGHDAVVPVSAGGPEPLCAVYARTCLRPIRARIDRGQLKMTSFWPDVRVRRVETPELARFGDPEECFLNVNSREDYERARAARGTPGAR